ncbi:ATP-binding cassette domain-containing protein [Lysinimonas soli]|uniref:ATP-binding cassette domain-containing protein n=1 Tax=Lysinimonas soli TaxID=1074233 RepID=A0ABW0NM94_9MICO
MTSVGRSRAIRVVLPLAGFVLLALFPVFSNNLYLQNMLILTFLLAIGASGWDLMGGFAGYISVGNSMFIGLGAYTTGIIAQRWGISPFIACFAGGLVAAIVAALLSLVTRRTRGMYFVIVTFAALMLLKWVAQTWTPITGGSGGLPMPIATWDLAYQNWPFYYAFLALLAVVILVSMKVRSSKLGLGLLSIHDDEDKSTGLGIRTAVYKMIAFVLASFFTGIAGGLYGFYISYLNPSAMFDIVMSILIVLAALLGGRGSVWGPVLGAFIIEPLAEVTATTVGGANSGAIRLLLFSGVLILVVLFLPRGVLPTIRGWISRTGDAERLRIARAFRPRDTEARGATAPISRAESTGAILVVSGLARSFGGVKAVQGVSLAVGEGAVTGLIGPNGSGKTTLFNLIDGTVSPDAGAVVLAGRALRNGDRPGRAHAGLARTYQLPRLFPSMTVLENVVLPERRFSLRRIFAARVTVAERSEAHSRLEKFGLAGYADIGPAELSYGQRKLVELAQVLTLEPRVIMLDEPAAGISPALSARLSEIIREVNSKGVSVLLVEHDLPFIEALCDDVYVMDGGVVIAHGTVQELKDDPLVVEAYLGRSEPLEVRGAASA